LARSVALKSQDDLLQQLVAEVGANRPLIVKAHPEIRTVEVRPRLFYWTEESEQEEADAVEERGAIPDSSVSSPSPVHLPEDVSIFEVDLYPLLGTFLRTESGLNVQRIDEKRSSNKRGPQGNKWLYPDIVALEDLTNGWTKEVRDCVSEVGARKFRLWSLEVKLLLNRSNVREAYFQAVSNSSWANFA
jgi:hypothetical protein